MIVSICGVMGCFAEMAARSSLGNDIEIVYCTSFEEALHTVKVKRSDVAVVPVKTSNSGTVLEVQQLLDAREWKLKQSYNLFTHHCLLALKGESIETISQIYSHPKALEECSLFLNNIDVSLKRFYNTAASAKYIADHQLAKTAAIASKNAASIYGLDILAENIENNHDFTTFYVVGL